MESGEAPASIAFCSGTVAAMVRVHQSRDQKTTLLMSSNNNDVMRLRADQTNGLPVGARR